MTLITHIEKYLGKIDKGWMLKDEQLPIQVARFENQPFAGVTTYVTLGLSDHLLDLKEGKDILQELVFSTYDKYPPEQVAAFMLTFAEYLFSKKRGLLRGDVVGPSSPLIPDVSVNGVYASIPVFFDDDFYVYEGGQLLTVLVLLLPLLDDECRFVKQNGWCCFEELLGSKDPDLFNLDRLSACQ